MKNQYTIGIIVAIIYSIIVFIIGFLVWTKLGGYSDFITILILLLIAIAFCYYKSIER